MVHLCFDRIVSSQLGISPAGRKHVLLIIIYVPCKDGKLLVIIHFWRFFYQAVLSGAEGHAASSKDKGGRKVWEEFARDYQEI